MRIRSLSSTEARVVLALEEERRDEVSLDMVERYARVHRGFARKITHDLVSKGWLQRVGRGRYILNPGAYGPEAVPETDPLRVGSRIVHPYYFGYATAAELWGFLLQPGRVYYLVTPTRTSVRVAHTAQFRLVRLSTRRFFGFVLRKRRGQTLYLSDPERTILDCLARPEFSGGMSGAAQVLARAKRRISWNRLALYLRKFGNRSLALRLGYLAEHVRPSRPPPPSWSRSLLPEPDQPWVPLGPPRTYGRRGPHDGRWHVICNVPPRVLFAEADTQ